MKKHLIFLMIALMVVVPVTSSAAPLAQGEDYVVQADDWLRSWPTNSWEMC